MTDGDMSSMHLDVPSDGVAGKDWGFSDIILKEDDTLVYYWWLA